MNKNTFGIGIIPQNDEARLAALHRYEVLDTPPEGAFNKIANLTRDIFDTPIALVALVDKDRVFFKANAGMANTQNVERGISLCSLAVLKDGATVFENAPENPCLLHNPLVAGSFGLRFYAGAPITTSDGYRIGTVCIVDHKPRSFSEKEQRMLENMASLVMDELELRLSARKALGAQTEMLNLTIHDLKNPLNNISGLANLIEKEATNPESVTTYTNLIKKAADNLNKVVQNLMHTSLTPTGEHRLKLETVDISSLLEHTLEENKASASEKKQQFVADIKQDVKLQGDPIKLRILFDNLISNAMKYSPAGGQVEVKLQKVNGSALLEVKDRGPGLSPGDKEGMFRKWGRLSARPTSNESSTGLGLYISKKIVEQHKGKIWAESEGKGKGSSFYVKLEV